MAVVGTTLVKVIVGRATEDNSPMAHTGAYYQNADGSDATGAGILAVRTDPGVPAITS